MNINDKNTVIEALYIISRECVKCSDGYELRCRDCPFRDGSDDCLFSDLVPMDFDTVATIIKVRGGEDEKNKL